MQQISNVIVFKYRSGKISQNPMYSTHIKRHHNPLESVQIVREADDSMTEGLA